MASPFPSSLVCSPNAAIAYDFLVGKGLLDFQAAAVIGNLQIESKMDPTIHQIGGGPGIGIAQWGPPRWKNLQEFAASLNSDPYALNTQLEFLWHELETDPSVGLDQLQASTSVEEAVLAFQDLFEKCGKCATDKRIAAAKSALYSCPLVSPPATTATTGKKFALAATGGVFALAALAAVGIYKMRNHHRAH